MIFIPIFTEKCIIDCWFSAPLTCLNICTRIKSNELKTKLNSVAVVRKRTILTERPPLVGEVSSNLCG
jgi:hypothetical protein